MQKIYVAASADTTKRIAAYAFKVQDSHKITSGVLVNSTSPGALLRAFREILETYSGDSLEVVTNNNYLIDAISVRIYGWQASGWIKPDGTPVANKDDLEKIYALLTTKFEDVPMTLRHPETSSEKTSFQVVASVAKAARK